MPLHLAHKRQSLADKQGGMASHTLNMLHVVELQLVLGIRQRNLRPVCIAVMHQFHDRLDKAVVCGIQIGCFIVSVYKTEKFGFCQYEIFHVSFSFMLLHLG